MFILLGSCKEKKSKKSGKLYRCFSLKINPSIQTLSKAFLISKEQATRCLFSLQLVVMSVENDNVFALFHRDGKNPILRQLLIIIIVVLLSYYYTVELHWQFFEDIDFVGSSAIIICLISSLSVNDFIF